MKNDCAPLEPSFNFNVFAFLGENSNTNFVFPPFPIFWVTFECFEMLALVKSERMQVVKPPATPMSVRTEPNMVKSQQDV